MRSCVLSLSLLALSALPAQAHFVWLLPDPEKAAVRMVFSDNLAPDDNADLLEKIKQTLVYSCDAEGTIRPMKYTKDGNAFGLIGAMTPRFLFATCRYGVFQRGDAEPALLEYYAKTIRGRPGKVFAREFEAVAKKLDLDVVFTDKPGTLRVLWKGKPLAKTKVFVTGPGGRDQGQETTDADGHFSLVKGKPAAEGLCGIRVGHTVKESGELDGKKYTSSKHWATFVFDVRHLVQKPGEKSSRATPRGEVLVKEERKEDADATKLLADARAARANWEQFPGFRADVEVNVEGRGVKGKIDVDAKGKVTLEGFEDRELEAWTRRQLSSVVGHRMDGSGGLKTPCAFLANDEHHPLGRAIQVLNDEFHSSYRIRDRQVIVVNRTMKDNRFTITVLENKVNAEKQYLPAHYVVNSWDLKTNALRSSVTFFHDWTRVGKYDLPGNSMIVTASSDGKLEARKLVLSNHKLK